MSKTSGAWLPASRVAEAARLTIDALKVDREELAQALVRPIPGKLFISWFAPTLEQAREMPHVRLGGWEREMTALGLRRLAEATAKLPVPNVFVSADDFSAIARQWDKTAP